MPLFKKRWRGKSIEIAKKPEAITAPGFFGVG